MYSLRGQYGKRLTGIKQAKVPVENPTVAFRPDARVPLASNGVAKGHEGNESKDGVEARESYLVSISTAGLENCECR